MSTKALVIAVVGLGCTVAAGTGAFLAQRMNVAERAEARATDALVTPAPMRSAPETLTQPGLPAPVSVSEAIVRPDSAAPAPRRRIESIPAAPARRQPVREVANPEPRPETPGSGVGAMPPPPAVDPNPPAPRVEVAGSDPAPASRNVRAPELIELEVTADSVIGIRMESALSTETARVEDRVAAVVTRDVVVDGRTAIPAGARLSGVVVAADRGGRFRERARLGVQFTSLRLPDNSTVRIRTEPIYRDGESPSREATTKIGIGAAAGAVIGGIIGGKKGAVIGGATGAGAGTAVVTAGDRHAAILESGASLTVRLMEPVTVTVEREQR
jgi:hypothetical protein